MQNFRMYGIGFHVSFRKNYKHFPLQITWSHTTLRGRWNTHEASLRVALPRPVTSFKYCSIVCK
jgi:hypothetical protein